MLTLLLFRDQPLRNTTKALNAVNESELQLLCPVKIVLAVALRLGFVKGARTSEEATKLAADRGDKTIEWTNPVQPVLPALYTHGGSLDLSKSASTAQFGGFLSKIACLTKLSFRINPHDIRRGAAQDFARSGHRGFNETDGAVRGLLGHSYHAMHTGVTQGYMGEQQDDLFRARLHLKRTVDGVEAPLLDPNAPIPVKTKQGTKDENLKSPVDLDYESTFGLSSEEQRVMEVARPESVGMARRVEGVTPTGAHDRPPITEVHKETAHAKHSGSQQTLVVDEEESNGDDLTAGLQVESTLVAFGLLANDGDDDGDRDVDEEEYNDAVLESLFEDFAPPSTTPNEASTTPSQPGQPTMTQLTEMTPAFFLHELASINITSNQTIAAKNETARAARLETLNGNSRNSATMFRYYCPRRNEHSCIYSTPNRKNLDIHQRGCTAPAATPVDTLKTTTTKQNFPCPKCKKAYATQSNLMRHLRAHEWENRTCPHGCEANKEYCDRDKYEQHMKAMHANAFQPTTCPISFCKSTRTFKSMLVLNEHLKKNHVDI